MLLITPTLPLEHHSHRENDTMGIKYQRNAKQTPNKYYRYKIRSSPNSSPTAKTQHHTCHRENAAVRIQYYTMIIMIMITMTMIMAMIITMMCSGCGHFSWLVSAGGPSHDLSPPLQLYNDPLHATKKMYDPLYAPKKYDPLNELDIHPLHNPPYIAM